MPKTVELCVQVLAIFPDKDNRDALIESLQKQYESGMIEERIKDMLMECLNEEGKVLQ